MQLFFFNIVETELYFFAGRQVSDVEFWEWPSLVLAVRVSEMPSQRKTNYAS